MDVPLYHHPVRIYASPSTECLLPRPGGPRFATQDTDPFGDPYLVGVQVGFRRRSLGSRPWADDDPAPGRRWSTAAAEVGRRARNTLRRASHGNPLPVPPPQMHPSAHLAENENENGNAHEEREHSPVSTTTSVVAAPREAASSPPRGEVHQPQEGRRRGSLHKWLRQDKRDGSKDA
ncbi:uncharacterized protein COLE_00000 [Cutaneotrichosporon oleaginosum]|nr:hypothetical protein COLE_00000 [Cutaneotrichosporon oleaginosum]